MRRVRYPRVTLTVLCLVISASAVGVYAYRHFRFPSIAETFHGGELVIAIDPSYHPFGMIVDDTFAGLDIDLGAALADALGLAPRFVMVNFDSAYDALETGSAHIALAALRVDQARSGDISYTWGYLNDGVMLVSPDGVADGWSLGGLRVGVELGAAGHAEARLWSRRVRNVTITTFDTPTSAFDAMVNGDVDVVLADAISVREYLKQHAGTDFAAVYLNSAFYAGAVRSDRHDILYHLNGAMLTLLNNGTVERLLEKYLGSEPRSANP